MIGVFLAFVDAVYLLFNCLLMATQFYVSYLFFLLYRLVFVLISVF